MAGVIFDAVPVSQSSLRVSLQALQVVYAIFLGASLLDFVSHVAFDVRLVTTRDGWNRPAKVVSRVAYLLCRTLSPAVLLMVLLDTTAPMGAITGSCYVYGQIFNAFFVPLLNAVPLIFVIRTISLYSFEKRVCIPLIVAYVVVFGASLSSLPFYGVNTEIPGSSDGWCLYDTRRPQRTPYNAAWRGSAMLLDLAVILLTLHRLTEGGLGAVFRRKERQQISASRLSATLLRQGFQYFVLIFVTDVIFMLLYWTQPAGRIGFQVAGSALAFCMPPILAGKVFRDARKIVQKVQRDNLSLIMHSGSVPQGHRATRPIPARGTSSACAPPSTVDSADAYKSSPDFKLVGGRALPVLERDSVSLELPHLAQMPRASYGRGQSNSDAYGNNASLASPTMRQAGGIHVGVSTVMHVAEADRSSLAELDGSNVEATVARNWPRLHSPHTSSTPDAADGFAEGGATGAGSQLGRQNSRERRISAMVAMGLAPEATAEPGGTSLGDRTAEEPQFASTDGPWNPQTPASPYPHTTHSQLANGFFGGAFQASSVSHSVRQSVSTGRLRSPESISNAWRDPGQTFDESDIEAARRSPF